MNKDTKILLIALVFIVIGAVSFSYIDATGKAVSKDITSISISPKTVTAGDAIYITVNPGRQGVYKEIEIYKAENDLRYGSQSPNLCFNSKCFEKNTIQFKLIDSWDNNDKWDSSITQKDYYAKIYDIYSGKWIRTYFSVERAYETKGPSRHP